MAIDTTDRECLACDGKGGTLEYDVDGDGAWAMTITRFKPCSDCIDEGRCPGCSYAISDADVALCHRNIDAFTCELCGWSFDIDRFSPDPILFED